MKWFKHMSSASDDEFLTELEDIYGWEGYGRWWKLLEAIASQMDKSNKCSASYSWVKWQSILKGKRNKLDSFLVHLQDKRKINLEQTGNILKITCPKLLDLRDNYTKDLEDTNNKLPSKEVEVEREVEKKEDKSSKESFVLPNWVCETDWIDYLEMRKKIKKPMTDRAKELAIKELEKLRARGFNAQQVLQQSVMNSWQGLFEPKKIDAVKPQRRVL